MNAAWRNLLFGNELLKVFFESSPVHHRLFTKYFRKIQIITKLLCSLFHVLLTPRLCLKYAFNAFDLFEKIISKKTKVVYKILSFRLWLCGFNQVHKCSNKKKQTSPLRFLMFFFYCTSNIKGKVV